MLKENFSIKRLSIFTLFWDWIKCHASDGSFFRIEVRTSGATDISIYNPKPIIQSPRKGTFLTGTKNKKNFIKATSCSNRLSKGKAPSKCLQSCLRLWLATFSGKNKHKSIVFKHIQWICVFSEKWHHYLSIVLCDLLIIYERIRHHLHLLRRTLKQTQNFVFIHI